MVSLKKNNTFSRSFIAQMNRHDAANASLMNFSRSFKQSFRKQLKDQINRDIKRKIKIKRSKLF